MAFRRNFDAEAAAIARGHRPHTQVIPAGITTPTVELPENRSILVGQDPSIRVIIERRGIRAKFEDVGGDWRIECASRAETDKLLDQLKLKNIHGVIKARRGFIG